MNATKSTSIQATDSGPWGIAPLMSFGVALPLAVAGRSVSGVDNTAAVFTFSATMLTLLVLCAAAAAFMARRQARDGAREGTHGND